MEETLGVEAAAVAAETPERKKETLEEVLSRHRLASSLLHASLPYSSVALWIG